MVPQFTPLTCCVASTSSTSSRRFSTPKSPLPRIIIVFCFIVFFRWCHLRPSTTDTHTLGVVQSSSLCTGVASSFSVNDASTSDRRRTLNVPRRRRFRIIIIITLLLARHCCCCDRRRSSSSSSSSSSTKVRLLKSVVVVANALSATLRLCFEKKK